jgi:O-antigen/teichoic acid export membrane protein
MIIMVVSLKKRYFFKFIGNIVGLAVNSITQIIIPRALGAQAYGNFNFLTSFFTQVTGFLDMGTSICFYTKLSQRPKEDSLVSFYLYFSILVSLVVLGFVGFSHRFGVYHSFWPGQRVFYIYFAALWGILSWLVQLFTKMADAYGVTVSSEMVRIAQGLVGLFIILILFGLNQLNLQNLFLYYFFMLTLFIVGLLYIMNKHGYTITLRSLTGWDEVRSYCKEFIDYSHPLFVYSLVGFVAGIFDTWILQFFGGSIEQGYYGLSFRIGVVCLIFTSAMTPLITREFAVAYAEGDLKQMAYLFRRYIPLLYSIAAYFSCFIATQADTVIQIVGGKTFRGAFLAVAIMAFYPIYQTYGQLSGSVFFASGRTSLYRNIGIIFLLGGLPLTYFFIAPGDKLGLNAGATGLAIKMVLLSVLAANVQIYFNAQFLGLRFWRYVGHQFAVLGCLLVLALGSKFSVEGIGLFHNRQIFEFLLAGFLYSLLVFVIFYTQPRLFGVSRQDIRNLVELMGERLGLR